MKLNYVVRQIQSVGRWTASLLLGMAAISFVWQSAIFPTLSAMAAPTPTLLATEMGKQVQQKVSKDAGRAKNFIEDTKDKVENMADKNARRVDEADNSGSFVERKAQRDAGRIYKRAEEDAARTERAVDNTKNVFQDAVENIKDALN